MKKFVIALTLVAILATALAGAVSAEDGVTLIYPFEDGATVVVPAGDSISLQWAWLAVNRGLVHTFHKSFSASYKLTDMTTGEVFLWLPAAQAASLWGPIEQIDPAEQAIRCATPFHWWSLWEYSGIHLPAGHYKLETAYAQTRPVNDGWHTCYDTNTGEPLAYPPSLYRPASGTWTVHIVVE